jgi:predicted O-methyltransferase YrrM
MSLENHRNFIPDWFKPYPHFAKQWDRYNQTVRETGISHGLVMEDLEILLSWVDNIPKGGTYMEIGVGGGLCTLSIAEYRPDIKCYGVDINTSPIPADAMKKYGIKNVELFLGTRSEDLCMIWDKGEIDMMFIDANHSFKNVVWDYLGWYPYIKKGGMIMFHDTDDFEGNERSDVGKLLRIFFDHPGYDSFFSSYNGGISSWITTLRKPL